MTLTLRPGRIDGRRAAPPSKSYTHRAFILAALSGNGLVRRPLASDDTQATLDVLHGLGFLVTREASGTRVGGVLRPATSPLGVRESGTTLRLLIPVAALSAATSAFTGGVRLAGRPLTPLLQALRSLGARADQHPTGFPITVGGPLRGGTCELPGDVSSQFLSGLLLAAPLAPGPTTVRITSTAVSRPYVDLTLHMLRDRGVRIEETDGAFVVPGDQRIRQRAVLVPGDYSSAAFLLAAAAVTRGRVTIDALPEDDAQGDRAILDHLHAFGASVQRSGEAVTVTAGDLHGTRIDVGATPDLFPVLCAVAACAQGETVLHGAPHLRLKESDRIQAMRENLHHFGIASEERPDGLVIQGGRPKGATIRSFNDHRVAMAGAVLAVASEGDSTLPDPEVVAKSYPGFVDDLRAVLPEATP